MTPVAHVPILRRRYATVTESALTVSGTASEPEGVAVDANGNVFISDTGNDRIQRLDTDGKFVASWGTNGTGPGELIKPAQIQVDATGNPWVADPFNNRIQRYTLAN